MKRLHVEGTILEGHQSTSRRLGKELAIPLQRGSMSRGLLFGGRQSILSNGYSYTHPHTHTLQPTARKLATNGGKYGIEDAELGSSYSSVHVLYRKFAYIKPLTAMRYDRRQSWCCRSWTIVGIVILEKSQASIGSRNPRNRRR